MAQSAKHTLIIFLLVTFLLIAGCAGIQQQENKIVCNAPYILVGTGCCLDQDSNSVCDKDELKKEEVSGCNKPYIQVGTTCCLDKNGNGICDADEETDIPEKQSSEQEAQSYTISDVQADINKVIFKEIVLARTDVSNEEIDFYVYDPKRAVFLARYSNADQNFFYVLPTFEVSAISIMKEENYLQDPQDFFNFVANNNAVLTSHLESREKALIEQVKEGDIYDYFADKFFNEGENVTLANHTSSDNKIFDKTILFDTVSKKIVETLIVSFEEHNVTYSSPRQTIKKKLEGLTYLQSYSIHCSPNLVLTIYAERYKGQLDETNIKNHVGNLRGRSLVDAQALISMCEQRYDFTYIRSR
ncbi:hypothetical protein HYY74_01095 [Candidatus Woesearchaeota archaeon]|nr:hypothetical protein [Candidatus Woesearchaeota archaeon]